MADKSKIEYIDTTVNPVDGCDGCELWTHGKGGTCYAAIIHGRFTGRGKAYPKPFDTVVERPGRMIKAARMRTLIGTDRPGKPWLNGHKRFIFIGDMSDIFSEGVSFDYIRDEIIHHIESVNGCEHFWMILTKRPSRMMEFVLWLKELGELVPHNLILMTSVTSQHTMQRARIIRRIDAPWKGLSIEPILGPVYLDAADLEGISWVIAGGESGPKARPTHPNDVRRLREVCDDAGVPFFFKQWGEYVPGKRYRIEDKHGKNGRYSYQNGCKGPVYDLDLSGGIVAIKLGKHDSGRLLDGREHNGLPEGVQVMIGQ